MPSPARNVDALVADLRARCPHLPLSLDELDLYRTDIYYEARHRPLAVAAPRTAADVQDLVRAAADLGISLSSRGAGLSYSAGYIPDDDHTVIVDTRGLDRIVEINVEDRYVTVEAGVTWAALRDALEGTGLTPPFWGTFSGLHATIGAGLSQGAKFFGSGNRGTSAESVIGLKVVTGTGALLTTGSAASIHRPSPFYRNYGPDLTGMFLADCGAFGIKVEATLQLVPAAAAIDMASFSFADPTDLMRAMAIVGGEMLASECFGMDPNSVQARLEGAGVAEGLRTLKSVADAGASRFKGLKDAVSVAVGGRRFADRIGYLMNCVVEDRDESGARGRLARIREIAAQNGGVETVASVPRVVRAAPFLPVKGLLTPAGRRINWLHTVVPNSRGAECFAATEAVYAEHRDLVERHKLSWGYLLSANGPSSVGVETLLRWADEPYPIHHRYSAVEDGKLRPRDLDARRAVAVISQAIIRRWSEMGGVHLQIGRKYPYLETREPATRALVEGFKALVDPGNVINPGNLLGPAHPAVLPDEPPA